MKPMQKGTTSYYQAIPDKNVETKCIFCTFLFYLAPVNSNPPFPLSNVEFVAVSFLLKNHAFSIEIGEGKKLFLKEKEKKILKSLNYFCPGLKLSDAKVNVAQKCIQFTVQCSIS